jgi:hypothetical protein
MSVIYELIQNADVKVSKGFDEKQHMFASIVIDDKYEHRFSPKSRVSKHLEVMDPESLGERLTGGSYFMVDDQLVDFRDGNYSGFVHDPKSIDTMMDLIGFQYRKELKVPHLLKGNADNTAIVLRKAWSKQDIVVPGYANGGADFDSVLSFTWNPFVKTVNSAFDLIRLLCTNGMVGITSFLNTKIPLVNRWEEHLDIASCQIQNKVNGIVTSRIGQLVANRASVAELMLLCNHAFDRLYSTTDKDPAERDVLKAIMSVTDVRQHLGHVYQDPVFSNKNLGEQMPGHLTQFDAYNIATELRSHTQSCGKSSDSALDRMANGLLFDQDANHVISASRFTTPHISSFADPNRAFYGRMS